MANPFQSYIIPTSIEAKPISILDLEPATAKVQTSLNGIQTLPVSRIFYKDRPTTYALVTHEEVVRDGFVLNKDIQTLNFSNIAIPSGMSYDLLLKYIEAPPFEDQSNRWEFQEDSIWQRALDVHYGANLTLDYYFDQFNRNGVDGFGGQTLLNAVAPLQIDSSTREVEDGHNAFWSGTNFSYAGETFGMMVYLDGQNRATEDGQSVGVIASIDVLGHELTHGMTQYTANLEYQGESGALNESISDIFGTLVKVYSKDKSLESSDWTWTIGEGFWEIRDMKNPEKYDNPSSYQGLYWFNTMSNVDQGGVHVNSGVSNHWFALITDGTKAGSRVEKNDQPHTNINGYISKIRGLGLSKAQGVVYRALNNYLEQDSGYADAREATLQAAEDLTRKRVADAYPGVPKLTKSDVNQIKAAWDAVGVGGGTKPSNLKTTKASADRPDFVGNQNNNRFIGSDTKNSAKGQSGFDRLYGFGGPDKLHGGSGHDVLDGGAGNDRLSGGRGYDRFILSPGRDKITDFTPGSDRMIWEEGTVNILQSKDDYPIFVHSDGETHLLNVRYSDFVDPFMLVASTQGLIGEVMVVEAG